MISGEGVCEPLEPGSFSGEKYPYLRDYHLTVAGSPEERSPSLTHLIFLTYPFTVSYVIDIAPGSEQIAAESAAV
jgi:hypothetical protein